MQTNASEIDVLILVGGKGTRLRSVINDRPKPMAEVDGRPFLDKLIDHISIFGHKRFVLCAGYMAEYLNEYYKRMDWPHEIILSVENSSLGTGGAIKNAEKYIQSDIFLVMNGDSFCPVDLTDLINFHCNKRAQISIVVTRSDNVMDYGFIKLDDSHKIVSFEEKKQIAQKGYINAGVYLFSKSVLNNIPQDISCSLETEIFPSAIGDRFFAYTIDGKVLDIGTPERYDYAKKYFSS